MRLHYDPILPLHARLRKERARVPTPVQLDGKLYDVMGVSPENALVLRDQRAVHQDMRIEEFAGRPAILDGIRWRVVSLEVAPNMFDTTLQLVDPRDPPSMVTVAGADLTHVQFPSENGLHMLGPLKHGIIRMASMIPRTEVRRPLRQGEQFEARLRGRELDGPYMIRVGDGGQLMATGISYNGSEQRIVIEPAQVAPRYETVMSLDFGATFDVDAFLFREDELRGQATIGGPRRKSGCSLDPLLGSLPSGTVPLLTNGAEHLAVFEQFIRDHAQPEGNVHFRNGVDCIPRKLTVFNLSVSSQGDARSVLHALVDFRSQNPDAEMAIVASKLGPTQFQESPEYHKYLKVLTDNRIHVNMFTTPASGTRQVMHAKGIIIDTHVIFSTGAVMDTRPIDKADFSIKLPSAAAEAFQRYADEAIHHDATEERRAELASELASLGVVINDPVAGLTYISRAQDALIRGASSQLIVSISELVDPRMTQTLIDRVENGLDVHIQVREVDPTSALLLADAILQYPANLRVEDTSWWEPRPHFNAIIADCDAAYLGTSYLWPTQCHMVHQGRSFENGVLLQGDATTSLLMQLDQLRVSVYGNDNICPVTVDEALDSWRWQRGIVSPCMFPRYTICLEAWHHKSPV
ncbi:uncharacterized protein LDX57_006937 [Aspergillus melleus]|uniref:uncharacterized protein n=1 Tax=Aspergillus melleus TaxID=138277 RepID=UPI001E8E903D|nr:uncharacterized protein LDX57_006937 [Aspergillus melleus]KAH8429270.1 hypothetical protein LDX57_006937 [Aspergillus melleus]